MVLTFNERTFQILSSSSINKLSIVSSILLCLLILIRELEASLRLEVDELVQLFASERPLSLLLILLEDDCDENEGREEVCFDNAFVSLKWFDETFIEITYFQSIL